jgi:hypothetical protein
MNPHHRGAHLPGPLSPGCSRSTVSLDAFYSRFTTGLRPVHCKELPCSAVHLGESHFYPPVKTRWEPYKWFAFSDSNLTSQAPVSHPNTHLVAQVLVHLQSFQ